MTMMPDEVRIVAGNAAHEAAKKALDDLFLHLGYDITGESGKDELRAIAKDLRHTRRWREATETVQKYSLISAVSVLVAGLLGLVWLAVKGG